MFKNYILLTFRTLARHKISSSIAILSLALGLCSSILLYSYINYHSSYEDFMPPSSQIQRLVKGRMNTDGFKVYDGEQVLSPYAASLLTEKISSIKEIASIDLIGGRLFHINDSLNREIFYSASEGFFSLLPFPLLEGERMGLLSKTENVVINKQFAQMYFPEGNALGKEIIFHDDESHNLIVSGVVNIPPNSHLYRNEAQVFLSSKFVYDILHKDSLNPQSDKRVSVYFIPENSYEKLKLKNELSAFVKSHPQYKENQKEELIFENIRDIHLYSKVNGTDANNPLYMVIFLITLTIGLLVISIINCVSILTALSITRTKEVGVRIVLGGGKKDLIIQFLTESVILSIIALLLALVMAELLQPAFSNLTQLDLDYTYTISFIFYITVVTLTVGILSGLLPAFYLSSLQPVESLKGNKFIKLRLSKKLLLIFQFLFASVILIWALTVNNELNHIKNMDVGFDYENLMTVYPGRWGFDEENYEKITLLKNEIKQLEGVKNVAHTSWVPMLGGSIEDNTYISDDGVTKYQEHYTYIDMEYINTLSLKILDGEVRNNSVVALKSVSEYRKLSIGDLVELGGETYSLSAIIDDYYLESALNGYQNFFHIVSESSFRYQIIRTEKKIDLKNLKKLWKSIFPEYYLLEFTSLANIVYEQNFPQIVRTIIDVINTVMIIILFISISGLFGLTLQSVKEKTKEIGIRKVLGAGYHNILFQLIKDSAILIIIAMIMGIPLGILSVKKGLVTLGYQLPIHNLWRISLFSALLILITGILLIAAMVTKAAQANPASALRYE